MNARIFVQTFRDAPANIVGSRRAWSETAVGPKGVGWVTSDMGEDERLTALAAAGDWGALERLLLRHERPLFAFFYRMGCQPSSVAELVQAVMVHLYEARHRYDATRPFDPWLYGIARNVWRDHQRRLGRNRMEPAGDALDVMASSEAGPGERVERLEEADLVRRAVERLPEDQRLVLVLRHWQGLTYKEVAEALGVPLGTVKWRLHEALRKLGQWLAIGGSGRARQ